jgi:hypothetical protein
MYTRRVAPFKLQGLSMEKRTEVLRQGRGDELEDERRCE